jgi:hypothetical protein
MFFLVFSFFYKKFIKKFFILWGQQRTQYTNLMLKELRVIFEGIKTIKIASSQDGTSFSSPVTLSSSFTSSDIVFGSGRFVMINCYSSGLPTYNDIAYSDNGVNWTTISDQLPLSGGQKINWTSITYGQGRFLAIGRNTNIMAVSYDGITWTQLNTPLDSTDSSISCIRYCGGEFIFHSYYQTTKKFYRMLPVKQ